MAIQAEVRALGQSEAVLAPRIHQPPGETEQFVLDFLQASGAHVTCEEGLLSVRLPEEVATFLGVPESAVFTFDPHYAGPDVHLLTSGSPVVDGMIQLTRRRGGCTLLMFAGLDIHRRLRTVLAWERMQGVWRQGPLVLPIHGIERVRALSRRIVHQEQLLFQFKVTYISDEPQEELHTITVDPLLERVVTTPPLEQAVGVDIGVQARQCTRRPRSLGPTHAATEAAAYTTGRAYRVACDHLETLVAPRLKRLEDEARRRLADDLVRIDAYFRDAAGELLEPLRRTLRRLTTAQARLHLLPRGSAGTGRVREEMAAALRLEETYRSELEHLENERQRRIDELHRRCEIRASAELISVARLLVPHVEWEVRLAKNSERREVSVTYDLLRERLVGLLCEDCAEEGDLTWTEEGELLCAACLDHEISSAGQ